MRGDGDQAPAARPALRRAAAWRMRGGLPILLGVLAGLALCAVAYFALTLAARPAPDATPTARTICADLTTQRYASVYELLSPDLQRQGGAAQFAASQRELDRLLGDVHTCQASVASNDGAVAALSLTLQRGQAPPANAQVALGETQGSWRITSYDQNF
ncbi:MAG TPA: hypothetical protein VIC27_03595 [Ktedonobacterales bacterium]|jgi:hypothetical protein